MDDHRYSTFALDLYWVAPTAELEQHLAECERCRSYVEHLGAIDQPIALPARAKRAWLFGAAVLAIAVVIVVLAWPRHPVVTIKGEPGVQVLIHRGTETTVWDTARPVRAGDALALRLACDEMTSVAVVVPDRGVVFEGACQDGVLPFTLVVDDQPGIEQIGVVLGRSPLDASAVQRAVDTQARGAAIWTTRFTFTKELL